MYERASVCVCVCVHVCACVGACVWVCVGVKNAFYCVVCGEQRQRKHQHRAHYRPH